MLKKLVVMVLMGVLSLTTMAQINPVPSNKEDKKDEKRERINTQMRQGRRRMISINKVSLVSNWLLMDMDYL